MFRIAHNTQYNIRSNSVGRKKHSNVQLNKHDRRGGFAVKFLRILSICLTRAAMLCTVYGRKKYVKCKNEKSQLDESTDGEGSARTLFCHSFSPSLLVRVCVCVCLSLLGLHVLSNFHIEWEEKSPNMSWLIWSRESNKCDNGTRLRRQYHILENTAVRVACGVCTNPHCIA